VRGPRLLSALLVALGLTAMAAPATLLAAGAPDAKPGGAPAGQATKTADPPEAGAGAQRGAQPGPPGPSAASTQPATTPAPADPAPAGQASPRAKRTAPRARAAAAGSVTIQDFKYLPSAITIQVGDTVTWANKGRSPHSATAKGGSFDTGVFPPGTSRSQTFSKGGTFSYFCSVHPFMHGTVRVVGAASGGGGGKSGSSGSASSGGSGSGSGAASGSGSTGSGSTPAPAQKSGSGAGSGSTGPSATSGSGESLPATGFDAGLAVALGAALVAAGVALRRRTREQP
jgi:LPXTG-motif cell wall-anchored protein